MPSEWAERYRELPEGSALPGRFSFAVTPYLREPLDACADPTVERVVCRKSAQVGWTDGVINNLIGWRIESNPGRMLVLFPREKTAVDFNDEKLEPMIEASESLAAAVNLKSRAAGNRQLFKKFPGGFLKLIASNAPGDVKSTSAPLVVIEEPDDCNQNVKGQGDSIKLAEERAKSYHDALIVIGGTPTITGVSAIDREIAKTDRRKWHVPCHHCGEADVLAWENVRWDKDANDPHPVYGRHHPETARYYCQHCGGAWTDADRVRNMRRGQWVATAPFTGARGYDDLNELYSPFPRSTMARMVEKFLEAQREYKAGKAEKLIAFWNSSLGRSYEYTAEMPAMADLEMRGEDYEENTVPEGGIALAMGVDVQHNRLAVQIWAFGEEMERWLVFWGEEYGSPANSGDDVWLALDGMVDARYQHELGGELGIEVVSIDSSDGQTSDAVYDWVRRRARVSGGPKVMAVKGRTTTGGEIYSVPKASSLVDPRPGGSKASRHGVKVYMVGSDRAKDLLLGFTTEGGCIKRCDRARDGSVQTGRGPGRMQWYRTVRPDFFEQLADSEVKVPNARAGGKLVWTLKAGRRNEALDCAVYTEHAARSQRWHLWTPNNWAAKDRARTGDATPAAVTTRQSDVAVATPAGPVVGGFMPTAARVRQ